MNKIKLLIADDFVSMRFVIKKIVEELGLNCEIMEASDGDQTKKMIEDAHSVGAPFTHVFCDWNMPGLTGFDVLEHCKNSEHLKSTYFVIITAESEQQNVVKALKVGADQFISKPISPVDLKVKFQKIFGV